MSKIFAFSFRIDEEPYLKDWAAAHTAVEVVLDEPVTSKDDVKALGITNGCFVCADPNLVVTDSGYI